MTGERWKVGSVDRTAHDGMLVREVMDADGLRQIAEVAGPDRLRRATLMAAAPLMLEALKRLIDDAQPDNWDDGDDPALAAAWRLGFEAVSLAQGLPWPPVPSPLQTEQQR